MGFFSTLSDELGKGAGKALVWMFTWERKGDEPQPRTNSLRIAVWSIILSLIFIPGLATCSFNQNKNSWNKSNSNKQKPTVTTFVSLKRNTREVFFPSENMFVLQPTQNGKQLYDLVGGMKYFFFHEAPNSNELSYVRAEPSSCVIILAGRKLKIYSKTKPLNAINVEDVVVRYIDRSALSFFDRLILFVQETISGKTLMHKKEDYWKPTYDTWNNSDFLDNGYAILIVTGMKRSELPDDAQGGLVCF